MKAVAPTVKPVSFELGGKNAAIVFADCDLEEAINGLSDAVFLNTGQVCLCAERVYVERSIFDASSSALKQKAERLLHWLADGGGHRTWAADLRRTSRQGARLFPLGAGRRRDGCHRRRRS